MATKRDYYEILNVDRSASADEDGSDAVQDPFRIRKKGVDMKDQDFASQQGGKK